jgi:hypothetical protein
VRNQEKLEPLVEQLARLLKPAEKLSTGPLRRLIMESTGEQEDVE